MDRKTQADEAVPSPLEHLNFQINLIDDWLTSPAVFSGGAIAGCIDNAGLALYTYPEISGYYLSYIAYRVNTDGITEQLADKAKKILEYQKKIWSQSTPPATRLYVNADVNGQADWRNQGLFIFDIAMLVRGITDIARFVDSHSWAQQVLSPYIHSFWEFEQLSPVRWFAGRPAAAPDRWSTRVGVYQLKVLAALQRAAVAWSDAVLQENIASVQSELIQGFNKGDFATHNPHSIAYAMEGAMLLGESCIDWGMADNWLQSFAVTTDANAQRDIDYRRADVIAQLLRLSCCEPFFNASRANRLYCLLNSVLNKDGSFQFSLAPSSVTYKNTWTALFARQALDFYRGICITGKPIRVKVARCLF